MCIGEPIRVDISVALAALGLPAVHSASFDYLLLQTDGSYLNRNEHTAGGCGVILWGSYVTKRPVAIALLSFQLPEASDSTHAEAFGLKRAADYPSRHLGELRRKCTSPVEVIFQTDNLFIIKHINKEAKCTHLRAAEEVAAALATVCPLISHLTFEYIPRE
jgi:hypothetical protein